MQSWRTTDVRRYFRSFGTLQQGFTMLEMIITLVIAGVLATVGAMIMSSGFRTYFLGRELAQDAAHGTLALERITRELRTIRSATAADLDIAPAAPTKITFTDVDGNTIAYGLSGGSVNRNAQPLADNVSDLTFTYLRNDGVNSAATSAEVYYVTVSVTVTSQNASMKFRGTVKPTSF
jgi:prepilin-type N-terminal cleavage/methylation domain-containing protein